MSKAQAGDRVRMTGAMPGDPDPIPVGTEGTVVEVMNVGTPIEQIHVDWDIERSLLLLPTDPFDVVDHENTIEDKEISK